MSEVPVTLPSTAGADAPAVLLPYQAAWVADDRQVKVAEKSRRIGLTWGEAADDVLIAASEKSAGGQNVWYIGYSLDMAKEYIDACGMWAKAFNRVASETEEGILEDEDRDIKTYIIRFPASGHRITALSSRPSNLRGKQGVVVFDEAAFHANLPELLKAALALLIWGGKLRVISTHNGDLNPFNELVTEVRAGKRPYSVHRIDFRQAVEQGLYARVCLRLGKAWHADEEAAWTREVYDYYGDAATEELDVIPSSGAGAYLPSVLIEACMHDAPVLRWECANDFAHLPDTVREAHCQAWLDAEVAPQLDALDDAEDHCVGQDFGRSGDLSVIAPFCVSQTLRRRVPFLVELRNVPFRQQEQILFYIVDRLPRFRAGKLDARGNGQALAEYAMQRYGATRIEQVMLSIEWYREHMPPFKAAFEDQTVLVPRDADVLKDLRAITMDKGVAKIPENYRGSGADRKQRHGDAAVALALGYAATRADVIPIEFASTGPRDANSIDGGFARAAPITDTGFGTVAGGTDFRGL